MLNSVALLLSVFMFIAAAAQLVHYNYWWAAVYTTTGIILWLAATK